MDYLHGDVANNELEAACYYEHARESTTLREAARLYKTNEFSEAISASLEHKFDCDPWFMQGPWNVIWTCPSFPEKGWKLREKSHADIGLYFGIRTNQARPLTTHSVSLLDGMGLFGEFKRIAEAERMKTKRPSNAPAVYQGWPHQSEREKQPFLHVLFTLDLTLEDASLLRQFQAWLRSPGIEKLRSTFKKFARGATGGFKDRLKDLAAWRLYRTLGYLEANHFAETRRKRGKNSVPRPFHDVHRSQAEKDMPREEIPLYSEQSGFSGAQGDALDYLAMLMPEEFGQKQQKDRFVGAVLKRLKARRKISKNNF